MSTILIGIAELNVVKAPDKISTLGLGSCCGVTLYDKTNKIGGMVHVMLPTATAVSDSSNKAKFADSGILLLLERVQRAGAMRAGLTAKLAGGAHMFASTSMQNNLLKVGERNVKVCREMLGKLRIPILSEDVLGTYGRTITFDPATGMLHIKTVGMGEKSI
ncbi:MAG: chemotaxis protein CheD [Candidatus Pelethousia sp.]|nr:chemotaxis protein CheD [Candidatus Pelethousia sp.]